MYDCILFGTGKACLNRINSLNFKQINIIGVFDNDKKKQGKLFLGLKIDAPDNIINYKYQYILVISSFYDEIFIQLTSIGVPRVKIIDIQSFLAPNASGRSLIVNGHITYEKGYRVGIEIGGAMNPIYLADHRIQLKQMDYTQHTKNEEGYKNMDLVKVDIIDDGETLNTINEGTLDFIIACHMLEHCRNPIGTIRNFLNRIRTGGIIFLAVPDKRYTFDDYRMLTTFEHLVEDDTNASREREYIDYCDMAESEAVPFSMFIEDNIAYIHYHVWDANSFIDFIYNLQKLWNKSFCIEQVGILDNGLSSNEIILVIKKVD
jgi:SAM-dependent methyltransferase